MSHEEEQAQQEAFYAGQATLYIEEVQQLVADVATALETTATLPPMVCGGHAVHYLHLAQQMLEGVRLLQHIAYLLVPMRGPLPETEASPTLEEKPDHAAPEELLTRLAEEETPLHRQVEEAAGGEAEKVKPIVLPPQGYRVQ